MKLKKEEKKKVILDAAEKLILEKGITNVSMEKVAMEADVATGTLYLYFKNKSNLLAVVNSRLNHESKTFRKKK